MSETEWPEVGDRVAVYYNGGWVPSVRYNVVERLTKTQVILADGSRFRRTDLTKTGDAHAARGSRERLVKVDSDEAQNARAHRIYGNARGNIEGILRPRSRGHDSYSQAERRTALVEIIDLARQALKALDSAE